MALLALRDVSLGFRGPLLLDGVNLTVDPGERVCLLGRNGTGKTTLWRLIQGDLEPDRGEIVRQQGLHTALLPQELPPGLSGTVFDEVARGLGPRAELLAEYHHLAHTWPSSKARSCDCSSIASNMPWKSTAAGACTRKWKRFSRGCRSMLTPT